MNNRPFLLLALIFTGLLALFLLWPYLVRFFYLSSPTLAPPSMASLGQFGDMFGGLNALFSLSALSIAIYTNYLQTKQMGDIRRVNQLDQFRYFKNQIFENASLQDAFYMIEYDTFGYFGNFPEEGKLEQSFIDTRSPEKDTHLVGLQIDRMPLFLDEFILFSDSKLIDEIHMYNLRHRLNRVLRNTDVRMYLMNLEHYYPSIEVTPFPNVLKYLSRTKLVEEL